MLLYATYNSNDPKIGHAEYQLIDNNTNESKLIYLETWNKMPTGNQCTLSQLKSLFNNGYKWSVVNDILTHRNPVLV